MQQMMFHRTDSYINNPPQLLYNTCKYEVIIKGWCIEIDGGYTGVNEVLFLYSLSPTDSLDLL